MDAAWENLARIRLWVGRGVVFHGGAIWHLLEGAHPVPGQHRYITKEIQPRKVQDLVTVK